MNKIYFYDLINKENNKDKIKMHKNIKTNNKNNTFKSDDNIQMNNNSFSYKHFTVMKNELINSIKCDNQNKIYVDGTLGGGGHSEEILKRLNGAGHLFSFDIDIDAINYSKKRLEGYKNLTIINDNYINIIENLEKFGIKEIDGGVIFDFGASYHQLTSESRGFSFKFDSKLDMRFDQKSDLTAYEIVNKYKEDELVYIFSNYGEERYSKRIARAIAETRKNKKIETTFMLCEVIKKAIPSTNSRIHYATRVFQALRIEVNNELKNIKKILYKIVPFLKVGGIISVLSFHSLEDKIVKTAFKEMSKQCRCSINEPVCTCGGPLLKLTTKKPQLPDDNEIAINPPSRSVKMRTAVRI